MRVLIADDNRDAADTLAMVLRLWGHEVRVVYDGPSALQLSRSFKPNAVLLDIEMPKVNGGDVALNLRRQSECADILIVATTGSEPDDPRLARYDGAFDAFLGKPCDLEKLAELLAYGHSRATIYREPMHMSH
ncbi:MAG TPA: response regulator [Gemmataceae bacterium]|jgi:CheY-like chemotaxis protein